jgi:N-acylethanolamine-hydrolysing acid amidase
MIKYFLTVVVTTFCFTIPTIKAQHDAPRYQLNLDLAPEDRWTEIVTAYNDTIHDSLNSLFENNKEIHELLEVASVVMKARPSAVKTWFGDEQYTEMESIARLTNLDLDILAAISTIYDLSASSNQDGRACTGIVIQNDKDEIIHGRNLDYNFPPQMENLTAIVDFTRDGKVVFTSVSYIFMTAFNTAMKPGVFSLSQDERDQGSVLINMYDLFLHPRRSTFSTMRDVMENAETFEDALNMLSTVPLPASSYFILGGTDPGQGAVITRNRDDAEDVWRLGQVGEKGTQSSFYVIETNYVRQDPLSLSLSICSRRILSLTHTPTPTHRTTGNPQILVIIVVLLPNDS